MNLIKFKLLTGSLVMLALGWGVARAESINPATKPQTVPTTKGLPTAFSTIPISTPAAMRL